jgi:hypothetical protein
VDLNFVRQSQMTQLLEPGKKYILGVTGFSGQPGDFNLHVQSVPGTRVGLLLGSGDKTSTVVEDGITYDIFSGAPFNEGKAENLCENPHSSVFDEDCLYNVQPRTLCEASTEVEGNAVTAAEFAFVTVSCPLSKTEEFRFHLNTTDSNLSDPVAVYWEGQRPRSSDGYVCSDDSVKIISVIGQSIGVPSRSSEIGHETKVQKDSVHTTLTSGAGVRTFYATQFFSGLDWETLGYTLKVPQSSTNDIWGETN